MTSSFYINICAVFVLASLYSLIELLTMKIRIKTLYKTFWGWIYILLNGLMGIIALWATFSTEIQAEFLGSKILLAGTSALALLRVIVIPSPKGVKATNSASIIEIIFKALRREYDRERSEIELKEIKEVMRNVAFKKAVDILPTLCISLMQTLETSEKTSLKKDIEELKAIAEGESIKPVLLGIILSKYLGIELLGSAVKEVYENIKIDSDDNGEFIDSMSPQKIIENLITKYS